MSPIVGANVGINEIQIFETDDGQRHDTLAAAEEHQDRRHVARFLYEAGADTEVANEIVERLMASSTNRRLFSGWFQNLLRLEAEREQRSKS